MHVVITGVSGFIGSFIARHLKGAGHTVTGLLRSTSRRDHVEPLVDRFVVGDQADESIWPELLDAAECVIHNSVDWKALKRDDLPQHLRSNLLGSVRLLEAAGERQFVFISTIAVHHDMRPRWAGLVDEDHPTRPGSLYGAYKAAVEAHLWAMHFSRGSNVCALRPCGVYGIDPNLERSIGYPIVEQLREQGRYDKAGGGKFVHVEDVAAAAAAVVGNPEANGKVCNLADCYARWADLAQMAAEAMNIEAEIDLSSPDRPKNVFTKDAAHELGVKLDRGHDGLREHMRRLVSMTTNR
ncbi:MAG: NAD(P)-dependent oxidoreductase [Planctomycetota bacterium]|nr:NAD(P)-dependent oxidoreductase [Planctomycetota bacterium]